MDDAFVLSLPSASNDSDAGSIKIKSRSVDTMDEYLLEQINHYRASAQSFGDAALDAMSRGDVGLARTASRQAAQYARIVQQLESGEKQIAPAEPEGARAATNSQADSLSV